MGIFEATGSHIFALLMSGLALVGIYGWSKSTEKWEPTYYALMTAGFTCAALSEFVVYEIPTILMGGALLLGGAGVRWWSEAERQRANN